jgi:hypothetical protein
VLDGRRFRHEVASQIPACWVFRQQFVGKRMPGPGATRSSFRASTSFARTSAEGGGLVIRNHSGLLRKCANAESFMARTSRSTSVDGFPGGGVAAL